MDETMDAAAVADAVAAFTTAGPLPPTTSTTTMLSPQPQQQPPTLPPGWILKESMSNPGYFYYYHMDTGISTWDPPVMVVDQLNVQETLDALQPSEQLHQHQQYQQQQGPVPMQEDDPSPMDSTQPPVLPSVLKKRSADSSSLISSSSEQQQQQKEKKRRKATVESSSASTTTTTTTPANDGGPAEVRVLHILKKHEGSRRPSSWRNPKITATKEEAHEELQGLLEILQEEANNPKELRATFEELARTESDCSSAKRGGDLGFFGRKKMQPAFEEASFALKKGEMTKTIVDTSSGSHIILRIG
ncbi:parvulin-like peptidyl-prolyl isomerase [Nitzschia inconspicua]|uniref:peptidylprolyl isomerase n=1 Tax=Nitzschia inconspicua TaxID=303405 RepID=A0A9K3PAP2_9STRA|nr:parvulin-like peptidyl-prolyl isomerase [Nitzschia inconspicua]